MTQWEYKMVVEPGLRHEIDKLGREDWEAVCVLPIGGYVLFKRPAPIKEIHEFRMGQALMCCGFWPCD